MKKLIEYGIPVKKYVEQKRNPKTGLYLPEPLNDGEVIFDRNLNEIPNALDRFLGRYWETWICKERSHPLLIRVVEELDIRANGGHAKLKIVEIPDDVAWKIQEYDGLEHIAEVHDTWN